MSASHTEAPYRPAPPTALWKRLTASVLLVTLQVSAFAQAVGPIMRGADGAPYSGFTRNGTLVQGGVVVGNPHQLEHDLQNPSLWTTGAVSLSNSTQPTFEQGSLADMQAGIAVTPEPGGLAMSRLYLTPTNPYSDASAGAPGCNAASSCNQALYNQILIDAQTGGYVPVADASHLARTHDSSSPEIASRGLNLYHLKPNFLAAEDPAGGATAFFLFQGAGATAHLQAQQAQLARLSGGPIFFTQQTLAGPGAPGQNTGQYAGQNGELSAGERFDLSLGQYTPSPPNIWGIDGGDSGLSNTALPGVQFGYIATDGRVQNFDTGVDQHFQGSRWQTDPALAQERFAQELQLAATQREAGISAANAINFAALQDDRALFLQGLDLYRFATEGERDLLHRLQSGEIGPGHPQYAAARALAEDKFRGAYAGHVEYDTQLSYTREGAQYQASQLQLGRASNAELFNAGFDLFDRLGDPEQERLLGLLQRGELRADHPRYAEIRALAEARFRVDYQQALEPPKRPDPWRQIVAVVVAAIVVYFTAGAASGWAATALSGATATTATGAVVVAGTVGTAATVGGIAATAVGSAVGAYAGAVISAGIQTGSLSAALSAGEQSLQGGLTGIVVNTAAAAMGLSAAGIGEGMGLTGNLANQVGGAISNTITGALTNTIAYGGDLGQNLLASAIGNTLTVVSANTANAIGGANLGTVGTEIAHGALGCATGMVRSGDSGGCVPGAAGAVVAHLAASSIEAALKDPEPNLIASIFGAVPGHTLADNVTFIGGLAGGTAAALAGSGNGSALQGNFALGQASGANAVENNYLTSSQITERDRALRESRTPQEREEINSRFDQLDQQQSQQAFNCVVKGQCVSVMEPAAIRAVLDNLNASCAPPRQCSPEAMAGIREINGYYGQAQAIQPVYPVEEMVLGGALGGRIANTVVDAVSAAWATARGRMVGEVGVNGGVNPTLLNELTTNGVKFTPENVIATARSPSGQVVFLETGNSRAGLQHIIGEHANDFANIGVSQSEIPNVVMQAVSQGKIVGYQGAGIERPIFETVINGKPQRIAITVSNNGFIVGANPAGSIK